jgi:predicted DNA-binding transcriptional regulator AlpA
MTTTTTVVDAPERWVTSNEVEVHLGVAARTLSDYRKRGLPHVKVSERSFRYRLSEVDTWMAQCNQASA